MSEYSTGRDIVEKYEIYPFEFLNRFIKQGLFPHSTHSGIPVEVDTFLDNTIDLDVLGKNNHPKFQLFSDIVKTNTGRDWGGFQLSEDEEVNTTILDTLLSLLYRNDIYKELEAQDQQKLYGQKSYFDMMADQPEKTIRTSTKHAEICRNRAARIWQIHPAMHSAELITYPAFRKDIQKKNGDNYPDERFMKWISSERPDEAKYLGPPKSLNIPAEEIENLLKDIE